MAALGLNEGWQIVGNEAEFQAFWRRILEIRYLLLGTWKVFQIKATHFCF